MKKNTVFFISDYLLTEVNGGAEKFNHILIKGLLDLGIEVTQVKSANFTPELICDDNYYLISNFMHLSEKAKTALVAEQINYSIIEHDHKYIKTNDPSKFINMLAPFEEIINRQFYKSADYVFCQSKIHAEVVQKNLLINNIVNLKYNLWDHSDLEKLLEKSKTKKTIKNSIFNTSNLNKGTRAAIKYCENKKICSFHSIFPTSWEKFTDELSKTQNYIFFPQWLESFCRVVVEAKILGCKITTNKLVGVTSEQWFRDSGDPEKLCNLLINKTNKIINKFAKLIDGEMESFSKINQLEIPKISIITSMYKAGEFIERFLDDVTQQTIFEKCELIIVDANSPDKEYKFIKEQQKKHPNIFYHRLDKTLTVQETMNYGIKKSTGDFLTLWNVDDYRKNDALEVLSLNLVVDKTVDLVYADCYETTKKNESFLNNSSNGKLYEHSKNKFSKNNMIKCLPGPMPLWRSNLNKKYGMFDEKYIFAGDWEMWLRAVDMGSKFKKIPKVLGLYYKNPNGISTSNKNSVERFKEEAALFTTYKHLFGKANYEKYKNYFSKEVL